MSGAPRHQIIAKYTEGACGILAVALHEQTGFPLVGLRWKSDADFDDCIHYGIRRYRSYWDIRGRLSKIDFMTGFGAVDDHEVILVNIAMIKRSYSKALNIGSKRRAIEAFLKLHEALPA